MDDKMKFEVNPEDIAAPKKRKGNGRNSPVIGDNGFDLKPGDNSKVISDMLYLYNMPKIDLDSDEAVEYRIQEYFTYCIEKDIKPGVEGLAMAIGVNRRTLWEWETGGLRAQLGSSRMDTIKKAKQFLALYMENLAQNGKINPITSIFLMKNHFGYTDKQEIDIKATQPLGEQLSPDEISKRIPKDIPVDVDFSEE